MMEPKIHRHISRRKKNIIPLAHLRTSEAVRTVVDHPRRIAELLGMLEEKDRVVRGRAADTVARLALDYPGRLLRILDKLSESLDDDAAYVRWHLVYALGEMGVRYPRRAVSFIPNLGRCLEDENRIVRLMARGALRRIASRKSRLEEAFPEGGGRIHDCVARIFSEAEKKKSDD